MLKGERVVLRALREADFDAWYRMSAENLEVSLMGNGAWWPYSAELARRRWDADLNATPDDRFVFAVELDGAFVGSASLKSIDIRSQSAWLSIVLDGAHLGQGLGRDTLRTLLRWAFRIQNFNRIALETWATNERAIRCYRSVGFVEEGRQREGAWVDGAFVDVVQMGILRREWLAAEA